jgi:DNA-binding FadR family transcriptional regulator
MNDMEPVDEILRRRLRIHGSIAHGIGVKIVSGEYPPGHILEGEIAASESFHVSRTAYREAVRILAAKGLVEARPKTGTRVSERSKWNLLDPDILSWIFESEPDADLVSSLFELRGIVEPRVSALAATRRTAEQVERMARALEIMEANTLTSEAGRAADQDFHAALLDASGNPFLISLSSGISAAVAWTTIYKARVKRLVRDAIPDHRDVYEAVAAGDPFAAHAAMKHLVDMALQETLPPGA